MRPVPTATQRDTEVGMNKLRQFLKGKKAYITAVVGLLGAVVAWADGQIDTVALLAAAWAAAQACFIRAGIAKEVVKADPRNHSGYV